VSVTGSGKGSLFDRVLGRVIYALAAHSDNFPFPPFFGHQYLSLFHC
jgi:hypothetical protein